MKKTTVLIADDHAIVAGGIQAILKTNDQLLVRGVVENGEEVMNFMEKEPVDVILMDINMPKMNGIDCTRKVKEIYPNTKVIILTMYNRKAFIRDLIDAGADGCILKSNTGKELLVALDRVTNGMNYFDHIGEFVDHTKTLSQYQLSEREIEIIVQISEGLTSNEIAERLFISPHTVKTHRKNIFRKLKVTGTDELVQFAMNEGII